MTIVLKDAEGNNVEINAEQIGNILDMIYNCEYEGNDSIEEFIEWLSNGCPDSEEDEDDEEYIEFKMQEHNDNIQEMYDDWRKSQ